MQQPLRILDQVRIASPCHMKWEDMDGDERKRFCGLCRLNVFNISDMTEKEVEEMVLSGGAGRKCIAYFQRSDGTILTKDCMAGAQPQRRSFFVAAAVALLTFMVSMVVAVSKPAETSSQPLSMQPIPPTAKVRIANVLRRCQAFREVADQLDPPRFYPGAMAPIAPGKP